MKFFINSSGRRVSQSAFVFKLWERELSPEKMTSKEKEIITILKEQSIQRTDFIHRDAAKECIQNLIAHQHPAMPEKTSHWARRAAAIAAILIIGVFSSIMFWNYNSSLFIEEILPNWTTVSTEKKEVKTIVLPDGSKISLNNASVLAYQVSEFNKDKREVWLKEGEAFFDVAHNPEKPFIVNYDGMQTVVLGTSFNIKAYRTIGRSSVTVLSGRVLVKKNNQELGVLTVGKRLEFASKTKTSEISETKADKSIRWVDGELNFADAPYSEIKLRLKMKYDAQTELENIEEEHIRMTAVFDENDPLEKIVKAIAWANDMEYKIEDKKVKFHKKEE